MPFLRKQESRSPCQHWTPRISRAVLRDIEKGRRPVTVERAKRFATVLGYSVSQFVAVAVEDQLREAGIIKKGIQPKHANKLEDILDRLEPGQIKSRGLRS
jgi:transcriptional regulator with XRE-family HTH domain